MLRHTFCHIAGVGVGAERRLWEAGIDSWDRVAGAESAGVSPHLAGTLRAGIEESRQHLAQRRVRYFEALLPSDQTWRLFAEFRASAAFLDIETTGLRAPQHHVTTIALYDGRQVRSYVQGRNLDRFAADAANYDLLVTYNGKSFDVPFLRQDLGLRLDQAHIDLRYVLRSLGYHGGLKGCERALGIDRGDLAELDGYFAVVLWQDFVHRHNPAALETLLAYNVEDAVNLERLMVTAYNLKLQQTPLCHGPALPEPQQPILPFHPDKAIIDRLRARYQRWG